MRILVARCEIAYHGRAVTRLGAGDRVILFKDDGSLCVHTDRGHKPLNYMPGPTSVREEGDVAHARVLYHRALLAFRQANDRWGIARSLTDLAQIACDERDHVTAHAAYREALELFVALGHKRGIARALEGFACSALGQCDPARALAIAAAAAHLREWIGAPLMPAEQSKLSDKLQPAWASLNEADSRAAYERGWAMSLDSAIQYALEESSSPSSG